MPCLHLFILEACLRFACFFDCLFFEQVRESVEELSRAILTIEATGDKAEAEDLLSKYAIMTPELQRAFKALENVQVTPFICHILDHGNL